MFKAIAPSLTFLCTLIVSFLPAPTSSWASQEFFNSISFEDEDTDVSLYRSISQIEEALQNKSKHDNESLFLIVDYAELNSRLIDCLDDDDTDAVNRFNLAAARLKWADETLLQSLPQVAPGFSKSISGQKILMASKSRLASLYVRTYFNHSGTSDDIRTAKSYAMDVDLMASQYPREDSDRYFGAITNANEETLEHINDALAETAKEATADTVMTDGGYDSLSSAFRGQKFIDFASYS